MRGILTIAIVPESMAAGVLVCLLSFTGQLSTLVLHHPIYSRFSFLVSRYKFLLMSLLFYLLHNTLLSFPPMCHFNNCASL